MKKALAIILPLTISATFISSAFAGPDTDYYVYAEKGAGAANTDRNDFNAFSVQLATGIGATYVKKDDNAIATPIHIPLTVSVGYSHTWNEFYLGGQAQFGWNFTPKKTGYENQSGVLNFNTKWQTMATLQIGGIISDTNAVYFDGGFALGQFNYANSGDAKATNYYQGGPVFGMGASLQLSDHINLDLQYNFIYYLKKNENGYGEVHAMQNLGTVGISFHFG